MYYIDKYMYHVHVDIKLVSLFPLKWGNSKPSPASMGSHLFQVV